MLVQFTGLWKAFKESNWNIAILQNAYNAETVGMRAWIAANPHGDEYITVPEMMADAAWMIESLDMGEPRTHVYKRENHIAAAARIKALCPAAEVAALNLSPATKRKRRPISADEEGTA